MVNSAFHFCGKLYFQASHGVQFMSRVRLFSGDCNSEVKNESRVEMRTLRIRLKTQSLTPLAQSREDTQWAFSEATGATPNPMPEDLLCLMTTNQEPIKLRCVLISSAHYREYKPPTSANIFVVTWKGCTYENDVIIHTLGKHVQGPNFNCARSQTLKLNHIVFLELWATGPQS